MHVKETHFDTSLRRLIYHFIVLKYIKECATLMFLFSVVNSQTQFKVKMKRKLHYFEDFISFFSKDISYRHRIPTDDSN